ncbi:MAG TPA: NgoMIV family type II restriction endonuclease [Candidatus Solibacter sp.]|nr:NgoMIV family type II restriction endonuclease [Candidatus Solibacter sp.]
MGEIVLNWNMKAEATHDLERPRLTPGVPMKPVSRFDKARGEFHARLCREVLLVDSDHVASNADRNNSVSKKIALGLAKKLGASTASRVAGQVLEDPFVRACAEFIKTTFADLAHLRPGKWTVAKTSRHEMDITEFEQYSHLHYIKRLSEEHSQLKMILGGTLYIKPDIVVFREPEDDQGINKNAPLVGDSDTPFASLRRRCSPLPILNASISCDWTIQSDENQISRSLAQKLLKYRKGHSPHLMVITAEPHPERLAAMCLGTGDIDYVYHFALPELSVVVSELRCAAGDILDKLVVGNRLRDICDLPLDLAI